MARQGADKGGEKGAGETRVTPQASQKVLPVGLRSRAAHPRPPRSRAPLPLQDPNFPSHPSEATSLVPPPVQISDVELCLSRKGPEEWGSFPRRPGDSRCSDSRSGGCKRTVSPGPDQSFLQNCRGQGMTQELGVPISGAGGWSRPRGTIHKVTAEPDPGGKRPARGGGAAAGHPTSLHTCSALRRARDTWEPSAGLPSLLQGLATSPGRKPFAPGPATRKRRLARALSSRLRVTLSSPDLGSNGEGVSFSSNQPLTPGCFPHLSLSLLPRRQTDKGHKEKKKKGKKQKKQKTTAPPGPILQPGAGRKKRGKHTFPSPPHPDAVTQVHPGSQEPRRGRRRKGRVARGRNQAERGSERARARERRKYPTKPR